MAGSCEYMSQRGDKGWSSSWVLGEGLTILHHKKPACYKMLHRALDLVGSHVHGNEPSGSIKGRKFLDWLSDYLFLKKGSAP
jgi:hypothetical protein